MAEFHVRELDEGDREWASEVFNRFWGSTTVVARGRLYPLEALPGFIAVREGKAVGLVTFHLHGEGCEIVTLNSVEEDRGVGSALVEAVRDLAARRGCRRLWLVTTNDNTPALRFYQRRGFRVIAVYPGAIEAARRLKPEIPRLGIDGIPLRDEIELELTL